MNNQLAELARILALRVRRDILTGMAGSFLSQARGAGLEFSELKEYHLGDDARHIHWPSAQFPSTIKLKRFQEEQEITDCIALDVSRSMTLDTTIWKLATDIASLLAGVATLFGNGATILRFTDIIEESTWIETGNQQLQRAIRHILPTHAKHLETHLPNVIDAMTHALKKPTRIFIISDFIGDDFQTNLAKLAFKHDVTLCHVMPDDKIWKRTLQETEIQDAETGQRLVVQSTTPQKRLQFIEQTQARARAANAHFRLFDLVQTPLQTLLGTSSSLN